VVLALVVAAVATWREQRAVALVCLALSLAALVFLQVTRARPGPTLLWVTIGLGAAALVALRIGASPQDEPSSAGRLRARNLATGAMLVTVPILGGFLLTDRDYAATRDGGARRIIEALERYNAREQGYPDTLQQLVEAEDLDAIPRPSVGFGLLETRDQEFTYQNFGINYLLEFSAPRWVQCAYNPPYEDEEEDEGAAAEDDAPRATPALASADDEIPPDDEAADADDGEEGETGAWSCPSKPPQLW
jgi:hypothetical protein